MTSGSVVATGEVGVSREADGRGGGDEADDPNLLRGVEQFLRRSGMTLSSFGTSAAGDPVLVNRLRLGMQPRKQREDRIRAFMRSWIPPSTITPPPTPVRTEWTPPLKAELTRLRLNKGTVQSIAAQLGLTERSVANQLTRMDLGKTISSVDALGDIPTVKAPRPEAEVSAEQKLIQSAKEQFVERTCLSCGAPFVAKRLGFRRCKLCRAND
jgi:hypothetical protein